MRVEGVLASVQWLEGLLSWGFRAWQQAGDEPGSSSGREGRVAGAATPVQSQRSSTAGARVPG